MTFNYILSEYKKEMIRNDKKPDGKNFEGRLRRILYRSIESGITRESIQGIKFNLNANYKGIKVITSQPFIFLYLGERCKKGGGRKIYILSNLIKLLP